MCGKKTKPNSIEIEYLKPMHSGKPQTQYVVSGKCGHTWKLAADEIGFGE